MLAFVLCPVVAIHRDLYAAVLLHDALTDKPVDADTKLVVGRDGPLIYQFATHHAQVMHHPRMDCRHMVGAMAMGPLDSCTCYVNLYLVSYRCTNIVLRKRVDTPAKGIRVDGVVIINEGHQVMCLRIVHSRMHPVGVGGLLKNQMLPTTRQSGRNGDLAPL